MHRQVVEFGRSTRTTQPDNLPEQARRPAVRPCTTVPIALCDPQADQNPLTPLATWPALQARFIPNDTNSIGELLSKDSRHLQAVKQHLCGCDACDFAALC